MNKSLRFLLFVSFTLSPFLCAKGQANIENKRITISNDVIRKELTISKTKSGHIIVNKLYDKLHNRQLLADHSQLPWFEFVVNHTLVTSNDPVWKFIDLSQRSMVNKGTEYTLNFKVVSGAAKGLHISIKEQLFPGSTLIREQLILHVKGKLRFELNKYKDKLHFIFPQYTYKALYSTLKSTEIRIATWDGEVLDTLDNSSFDSRQLNKRYGGDHNLSQSHMFHPKIIKRLLHSGSTIAFKGPLSLISDTNYTFIMAYEHASQDNMISDGTHNYLKFLQIDQKVESRDMSSAVKVVRGGYLDGEEISAAKPYNSVWTATGFYLNKEQGQPKKLLHNYLLKWITEFPKTRETKFSYNTWARQVDGRKSGKEGVLNYDQLFKEIRYAHQLGIETFILDAGWGEKAGVWKPNHELDRGFAPIYDTLKKYNMKLGAWMAPLLISPEAKRYKQHPEWVIRDKEGTPVRLGGAGVFDFVSGFSNLFIEDCKRLIDHGVRYFKWDAIGTYYSSCTDGFHGDSTDSKEEVIARYQYLLPIYIKKAMVELMHYNKDVVIEIDLTEKARSLMGLSTISAGKLFFMNNGASDYGDYSQYRAKSMRTVANEYNGIIPLQLFTYYNYPQNSYPFISQRYNVNSSIICGKGLWGNLSLMNSDQRARVIKLVNKAKRVSPFSQNSMTTAIGKVGASPEIYTTVNAPDAAGQVIAFSGSAMHYVHSVLLNKKIFLGVLDNAFELQGDTLKLYFQFPAADESREAFILPNQDSGIHILSCSSWLDSLSLNENKLTVVCGAPGVILISWPKNRVYPQISGDKLETSIHSKGNHYVIKMKVQGFNTPISIE